MFGLDVNLASKLGEDIAKRAKPLTPSVAAALDRFTPGRWSRTGRDFGNISMPYMPAAADGLPRASAGSCAGVCGLAEGPPRKAG